MSFQPFGYRFEVRSPLPRDALKAAICDVKGGWFDTEEGAQGRILGPFICIQSGGPRNLMTLVGRFIDDNPGTRIVGRAGYLGSILPARHEDAEAFIRFLRNSVVNEDKARYIPLTNQAFSDILSLEVSGEAVKGPATPESIRNGLLDIRNDGFLILSFGDNIYLQAAWMTGGYIVEKREGDDSHHYRAMKRGRPHQFQDPEIFEFSEALAIFVAYGAAFPMPPVLKWKKIKL